MKITLDFKDGKSNLHVEDMNLDDVPKDSALRERLRGLLYRVGEALIRTGIPSNPEVVQTPEHGS